MIIKSIVLFIILLIISSIPYKEKYYTFFKPYQDKEIKYLNLNKNDYIYKKIKIGYLPDYKEYTKYLSIKIIEKTKILNIYLLEKKNINKIINDINNYNLDLIILPRPIIHKINQVNNIRFVTNLNSLTFYIIYNSFNIKVNNIKDLIIKNKKINIGIVNKYLINYEITYDIFNNIFDDLSKFEFINDSYDNLMNQLKNDKDDLNIITFIDSNPSKMLTDILINDSDNKFKIMPIKNNDIYYNNIQTTYLQDFVKFEKFTGILNRERIETVYFFNMLLSNDKFSPDIVFNILTFLNRKNVNTYLKGNMINDMYFNREPNMLPQHKGVDIFYNIPKNNIYSR